MKYFKAFLVLLLVALLGLFLDRYLLVSDYGTRHKLTIDKKTIDNDIKEVKKWF